jgi:hypothetical protein
VSDKPSFERRLISCYNLALLGKAHVFPLGHPKPGRMLGQITATLMSAPALGLQRAVFQLSSVGMQRAVS